MTNQTLSRYWIVDNPRRYPRHRKQAGGRISGETRRRIAQPWHKAARRLYRGGKGCNFSQIARVLGRHVSTVSRLLRGIIRTLLDAEETAAGVNPYPAARPGQSPPLRELYQRHSGEVSRPWTRRKRREKRPWNWCKPGCGKDHRHYYGPSALSQDGELEGGWLAEWRVRQAETATRNGAGICPCGTARPSAPQPCPMCGRTDYPRGGE